MRFVCGNRPSFGARRKRVAGHDERTRLGKQDRSCAHACTHAHAQTCTRMPPQDLTRTCMHTQYVLACEMQRGDTTPQQDETSRSCDRARHTRRRSSDPTRRQTHLLDELWVDLLVVDVDGQVPLIRRTRHVVVSLAASTTPIATPPHHVRNQRRASDGRQRESAGGGTTRR